MKENSKHIVAPTFRFPEFEGYGEWLEKTFQELFEIGNGRDYKHIKDGDIPVYGSGGYMLSVNDFLYDGESVCIGRKGTIDNPIFLTGKFWTVDTLFYTYEFKDCLPKFIFYIFSNINWLNHNEAGGVPSLSKKNIYKITTSIPPVITEQQKIASCLSSLDELLAAHNEKLDALKDHKKGLMQNLFPQSSPNHDYKGLEDGHDLGTDKKSGNQVNPINQGSDNVPKVRFSEFEGDGEWVEKSFEEIFEIGNGRDYKHLGEGDIPVYGSGGYMLSVNDYLYDGESACIGRKGTINNPMFLSGKFWTVDTLFYTHSFKDCLPKFIYYIFQNINWLRHNEAGGVPSLSKTNIYKIKTIVPRPEEQQKIVDFLSELDELINAQAGKIEQLQQHKKGLMQGLFPNPSASSGETIES